MCKQRPSSLTSTLLTALALALSAAGAAAARDVTFDASCTPSMTRMEQRLYQKANEGPTELRQFMWIRRAQLQADVIETGNWAEAINAARTRCLVARGLAPAGPQAANQFAETAAR
jgi:hypothetical protein